jgi:hypothetical protein
MNTRLSLFLVAAITVSPCYCADETVRTSSATNPSEQDVKVVAEKLQAVLKKSNTIQTIDTCANRCFKDIAQLVAGLIKKANLDKKQTKILKNILTSMRELLQIKQKSSKDVLEDIYHQELTASVKKQLQEAFATELEQNICELTKPCCSWDYCDKKTVDIAASDWITILDYTRANKSLIENTVIEIVKKAQTQLASDQRFADLWTANELDEKVTMLLDCFDDTEETEMVVADKFLTYAIILLENITAQMA